LVTQPKPFGIQDEVPSNGLICAWNKEEGSSTGVMFGEMIRSRGIRYELEVRTAEL
jgi:hypothetical protein